MVKWRSWVGLLMVEWHILYTPVEPRVMVTAPEDTTPPCDEVDCIAPLHDASPASRNTTESPFATPSPPIDTRVER